MARQDLGRTEAGLARTERERSSRSIPAQIGRLFYAVGFFGASYPVVVIIFSIIVILTSCYPLLTVSFPGNRPKEFIAAFENYSTPPAVVSGESTSGWPRWYRGPPTLFVQQILIRSAIYPWNTKLITTDSFRGTLSESFGVLELVKNISENSRSSSSSLSDLCFHVLDVKSKFLKGKTSVLPENQCLIVSPANFWNGSYQLFQNDPDILNTILDYQSHQQGRSRSRSGLAELLLGVNVKDTGLRRLPVNAKQRLVTYAVTIVLQKYDPKVLEHLEIQLKKEFDYKYSVLAKEVGFHENITLKKHGHDIKEKRIAHIFYPSHTSLIQLIPLAFTYIAMFIYVYFSVKKIEMVKSKLGLAFSALVAVVASLCMSVGLCTHFGLMYEINAKDVFPYVVIIIGLENMLVLTRSVVSTGSHLDSKIRVAQGLSKEGWSIIKNLSAEVTILTIGFFTFIPRIQEFCILAILGLLSDFFIQTFFFATVLSVDMRRNELTGGASHPGSAFTPFRKPIHPRLDRVKSNPGITNGSAHLNQIKSSGSSVQVVAPSQLSPIFVKIPRRLQVISFWAKTRFFQRTFVIFMVGWISFIIYESGILAHFNIETNDLDDVVIPDVQLSDSVVSKYSRLSPDIAAEDLIVNKRFGLGEKINYPKEIEKGTTEGTLHNSKLLNELFECNSHSWRRLSLYHWQILLGVYNISLSGRYISILPPICLGIPVEPTEAISRRNKHDQENAAKFRWQASSNEPGDLTEEYDVGASHRGKPEDEGFFYSVYSWDDPYIPTSPVELTLTLLLAIPSAIFISYSLIMVYRCMCSRNYAEWRSSWTNFSPQNQDYYTQVVFEAVPLILAGHREEVECMGSDGNVISTVCLDGILKIWNINTGDSITTIDRKRYFEELARHHNESLNFFMGSDTESPTGSSPPSNASVTHPGAAIRNSYPKLAGNNEVRNRQHTHSWSESQEPHFELAIEPFQTSTIEQSHSSNSYSTPFTPHNGTESGYFKNNSAKHRRLSSFPSEDSQKPQSNTTDLTSPIRLPSNSKHNTSDHIKGISNAGNFSDSALHRHSGVVVEESHSSVPSNRKSVLRLDSRLESPIEDYHFEEIPPVWCLDSFEGTTALGTGSGRIEFWDSASGKLKCAYQDENEVGVVFVKMIGNKVVTAKINGSLDFLQIESFSRNSESPSLYHRIPGEPVFGMDNSGSSHTYESELRCVWLSSQKAHQQPITCLECDAVNIITGSQDHTLKVFRLKDQRPLFSLHGHYGPITCVFIDKVSPLTAGSGSQDGLLCVWDLQTGMCVYSIQAHDGPINALTYSVSYIISAGGDDKICVWERFQGHLLNTIQLDHAYCSSLVMLTHNLLVTSKQGSLIVWDTRSGEAVRAVRLGHRDKTVFVRQIMVCADAILCDYGSQLRLVRFPSVISKVD